jgi:hypothetical protein
MAEIKSRGFTLGDLARIIDLLQSFLPKVELLLQKIEELIELLRDQKQRGGDKARRNQVINADVRDTGKPLSQCPPD